MENLTFKVTDFEGPLDLLLALISKNKMNIYDIEIMSLIGQYFDIVNNVDTPLEQKSDFIDMSARLIYMKSVFLLPKNEEQERLKQELTGQLIEYSLCKEVALKLKVMAEGTLFFVRKPQEIELDYTYSILHEISDLTDAYATLSGKKKRKREPSQERFEKIVTAPVVSVSSRIVFVLRNLMSGKLDRLSVMFRKSGSKSESVATFLALLELIRGGRITIDEDEKLSVNRKVSKRG